MSAEFGEHRQAFEFSECLACAVADISDFRHRRVMTLFHGLEGQEPLTLQEIGTIFGRTRERVRQNRDQAIDDIRSAALRETSHTCADLVGSARRLVGEFSEDPVGLLESMEAGSGSSRPQELFILAFCLVGEPRAAARTLAGSAVAMRRAAGRDEGARRRRSAALAHFTDQALWPSTVRSDWSLTTFRAQRNVQSRDGAGVFHSTKLRREVQYESGLELAFLERLEGEDRVVGYQEQPLGIRYRSDGGPHTYIPDVAVVTADGRALMVEIKPRLHWALMTNLRKWAALARWCGQNGAGLLIGDGRRSVRDLLSTPCDDDFRDALLDVLHRGPLALAGYRHEFGSDRRVDELVAVVLRESLAWQLSPFRLCLPTREERVDARAFIGLLRSSTSQLG